MLAVFATLSAGSGSTSDPVAVLQAPRLRGFTVFWPIISFGFLPLYPTGTESHECGAGISVPLLSHVQGGLVCVLFVCS